MIDLMCEAATKRLAQSVAISAGLHKLHLSRLADRLRVENRERWRQEDDATVRESLRLIRNISYWTLAR